jgi:hypothetical protein
MQAHNLATAVDTQGGVAWPRVAAALSQFDDRRGVLPYGSAHHGPDGWRPETHGPLRPAAARITGEEQLREDAEVGLGTLVSSHDEAGGVRFHGRGGRQLRQQNAKRPRNQDSTLAVTRNMIQGLHRLIRRGRGTATH